MHAMQLADPKAAEVFDPKAWKRIKDRTAEIKIDVKPDVPSQLQATLRPYQVDGFHFLAYLATNGFGGILADDMGLGKTIQSITYVLWLREEFARKNKSKKKIAVPPVLIVCPKSVLDVWAGKRRKFAPGVRVLVIRSKDQANLDDIRKNYDMVVVNYAQLRVCGETLNQIKWLTVILDEGQQIRTRTPRRPRPPVKSSPTTAWSFPARPLKTACWTCGPSWPSPCPAFSVPVPTSRSALTSARTRRARTAWPRA